MLKTLQEGCVCEILFLFYSVGAFNMDASSETAGWLTNALNGLSKLRGSLKDNDLSNIESLLLNIILLPTIINWWSKRTVHNIPGLIVTLSSGLVNINGVDHDAVDIMFENKTGSIVYLNNVRLRNCSHQFPVTTDSARDIGESSHVLTFPDQMTGKYEKSQIILQTGQKEKTIIAVERAMPDEFFRHEPCLVRRCSKWRKFFALEYTAMVAEKKYSVRTTY